MSIQHSKFNKQKKFFPPILLIFFISSSSSFSRETFFYIFLLYFFSLAHFSCTSHSSSFPKIELTQLKEGKLNWLENCFQIQIFKFHLYTSRCLRIKERRMEIKRTEQKKLFEECFIIFL